MLSVYCKFKSVFFSCFQNIFLGCILAKNQSGYLLGLVFIYKPEFYSSTAIFFTLSNVDLLYEDCFSNIVDFSCQDDFPALYYHVVPGSLIHSLTIIS